MTKQIKTVSNEVLSAISDAVEASGVCCPEQVSDMCVIAAREGKDWKAVLAKAVESDAEERKALGVDE